MDSNSNNLKKEIIYYANLLEGKGLVNSLEGNLSMLDRTAGELYITPSGTRKAFLTEDMIAVMKDGSQIGGTLKDQVNICCMKQLCVHVLIVML
jgi:L-fuculose-phosphate aldolase